jgi:FixJ family two-component response regulator/NAD-dependent dihydropyrimidine dehydrogenase PreA subunit
MSSTKIKTKPVLLIENETVLLESVNDLLTNAGYEVQTVENEEQALKSVEEQEFGIIIIDLDSLNSDDLELLSAVKEKQPSLDAIVLAGSPSVDTAVAAIKRGAIDFLPKPLDLSYLMDVVQKSLGKVESTSEQIGGTDIHTEILITINGQEVKATKDMTILQAARSAGIDIPTLCYHEGLPTYGGCRLCTVEINKGNNSSFVASCIYPVEEGLKIETESKPVVRIRKMLLEMMWRRSPGVQTIKNYGVQYEIDKDKFGAEPTYCILCGVCVRYCHEVAKKDMIGFIGRGNHRQVMFLPGSDFNECLACGQCYKLCPTGVIPSNYGLARLE